VAVNKYPITSIRGKEQVKKKENNLFIRSAPLYLKIIKIKSIDKTHNILYFYSKLLTSNNKTHLAYRLFGNSISLGFIDE
jgi:hypothetical protein